MLKTPRTLVYEAQFDRYRGVILLCPVMDAYLVHRDKARARAPHYCERLAEAIPREQFKIPIQGVIGGNVIARSTIQAYRKDVTAKCYGSDVTRKWQLIDKQKTGKMKLVGHVQIPQKAFVSVLTADRK